MNRVYPFLHSSPTGIHTVLTLLLAFRLGGWGDFPDALQSFGNVSRNMLDIISLGPRPYEDLVHNRVWQLLLGLATVYFVTSAAQH